jgi:predicted nuclease of predicted toxin-antitoxin system
VKLDENLPVHLAASLQALGHDADTVHDEALRGAPDETVWEASQRAGRFLITQDLDFADIRRFVPGLHEGVLILRLARPGQRALVARTRALFEAEPVETWRRCVVVATERKVRVRRP